MFKLFNKSQTSSSKSPQTHPAYPKEVLEIHHEFETAAEKLLDQAKQCIIEAESKDVIKISRLQSLGFKQAAQVVDIEPVLKKAELSREQIELIQYYKQHYPFNKFITEEQVKEICYKYNLICGDVSRFKGFVPEKNLREIEKFKLKEIDNCSPKINEFYIIMDDWSLLNVKNLPKSGFTYNIDKLRFLIDAYLPKHDFSYFGNKSSSEYSNISGWGKIFQYRLNNLADRDIQTAIEHNQQMLKICAPLKDMDITGLTIEDGYLLKQIKKHIPDPVVLQPVKGGYLILTAWGDEASDPIVVNEIMN